MFVFLLVFFPISILNQLISSVTPYQIDYPDAAAMKSANQARAVVSTSNIELLLNDGQQPEQHAMMRRMNSDSIIEQLPEDMACGSFLPHAGINLDHPSSKRFSRASDTSSAYSGSDIMHNSQDDCDTLENELSGLAESAVDSDDEDCDAGSTEVRYITGSI